MQKEIIFDYLQQWNGVKLKASGHESYVEVKTSI